MSTRLLASGRQRSARLDNSRQTVDERRRRISNDRGIVLVLHRDDDNVVEVFAGRSRMVWYYHGGSSEEKYSNGQYSTGAVDLFESKSQSCSPTFFRTADGCAIERRSVCRRENQTLCDERVPRRDL